jgi:PAS domain S-box-containing protein
LNLEKFPETLVRETSDAIILSDKDGAIQFWNKGAERMFGFTSGEAIGQSLDIIIPENLRKSHWSGYEKTMETGKSKYAAGELLSVPAIRKDGERISVQFSILGIPDTSGGFEGVAAIMRDVTKDFDRQKALKKSLAEYKRTVAN